MAAQLSTLRAACEAARRPPGDLDRLLLHHHSAADRSLSSVDAFVDWAGPYRALGITELVLHWPVPDSVFASDPAVFERIAREAPSQLAAP